MQEEDNMNASMFQTPSKTHSMLLSNASSGRKFFPPAKSSVSTDNENYISLYKIPWYQRLPLDAINIIKL